MRCAREHTSIDADVLHDQAAAAASRAVQELPASAKGGVPSAKKRKLHGRG